MPRSDHSAGAIRYSKRQLESGWQVHARGHATHALLTHRRDLVDRIIERSGNQIFCHFRIIGKQLAIAKGPFISILQWAHGIRDEACAERFNQRLHDRIGLQPFARFLLA